MEEDQLFDSELEEALIDNQLKDEKKKYLKWILGLIVLNLLLAPWILKNIVSPMDMFLTMLEVSLFAFNLFGFILGGIRALFPYKGLSYTQKFVRFSVLSILGIHGLMTLGLLLVGIMTLLGLA